MLSGGTQLRGLYRYQSEEMKILNIIFYFLDWESNPQPVVFTGTRLCLCATTTHLQLQKYDYFDITDIHLKVI